ncbi:MAG: inorganic diphosphatase [Pseudomonadota bacterium]
MSFSNLTAGKDIPRDFNVVIEIPRNSNPVKYEVCKDTGVLLVDRFLGTSMIYPCDYGYIPQTLSGDGDPVDVLVVCPYPLTPGSVIRCRTVGLLRTTDEKGPDAKLLAVPVKKLTSIYDHVQSPEDLGQPLLAMIEHFFTHYKDLEAGKWVKVDGWENAAAAQKEIVESVERFNKGE